MIENLTDEQRNMVLRFLLYRMPMDMRREMMRALPLAYVKMYPDTAEAVRTAVTEALTD